jgi:hypothetical protein
MEEKHMKKGEKKIMTLPEFGPWLQKLTGAEFISLIDFTGCVVSIDHIEPGCFMALYVRPSVDGLVVLEMVKPYESKADAWQALKNKDETYPSEIFEDWVVHQYLTDRNATVEKMEF